MYDMWGRKWQHGKTAKLTRMNEQWPVQFVLFVVTTQGQQGKRRAVVYSPLNCLGCECLFELTTVIIKCTSVIQKKLFGIVCYQTSCKELPVNNIPCYQRAEHELKGPKTRV